MSKFYQTLPGITDRVLRLRHDSETADRSGFHREKLDMFTVPGYANASFMRRRALLVKTLLAWLPVRIRPEELIFGSVLGMMPLLVTETYEERKAWADLSIPFPYRNTVYGTQDYCYENRVLSEEELHDEERGRWSWGHSCFGLKTVLEKGYNGIADDARRMLAQGGDDDQVDFWQSVIICCEAIAAYAARYADAIEALAVAEQDETRREELRCAAICVRQVPAGPARSFYEAVQATWFAFMCHHIFNGTDLGRLDQYLYPYYAADEAAGLMDAPRAQELLDMLWLRLYEHRIQHPDNRGLHPSIMLAGVNADGRDGTNAITCMCLNATRHIATPNPKLSLRVNDQTPQELYDMAHEMLLSGLMMPDFYNEKAVLEAYMAMGVPMEDAVCFAQSVCEEVSLAGVSEECTNEGPHIDLHDMVMRALRRSGADTSFEDILSLVDEEIIYRVGTEVDFHHRQTEKLAHYLPQPLHSCTIEGCVASGRDIYRGGAKYNNTGSVLAGIATAANSLYAVKRLVYDEKRLTLAQLLAILDADYAGHELLRAEILAKFPKYGNDDDVVDCYAVRMFETFARELGRYRNSRGGVFKLGAWASEFRSNYPATPDGRKRWDSFAVNVSPTPGSDQKGATAVIRSTTKLGLHRCTAGGMVDVTLSPSCLKGERGVMVLRQLVEAYCMLGGSAIQFNFVDSAMLEAARCEPMKYKNLMVRVWGYNDYFLSLNETMQNHIIDRTRHEEHL